MKIITIVKCLFFLVLMNANNALYAQASYTLCANQTNIQYRVTDNAGSIFYWMVEGGQIVSDPHANTIIVNWGNIPGEYNITVYEQTATSCLGNNKSINIRINESPTVTLGNIRNICEGEQLELIPGEGFISYLWQDGSSESTFRASENGIYWVEVTNQDGCSFRDSVLLIANPVPEIDLGKDTMLCELNELVLDAGAIDGIFDWNNGATSQTIIAREGDGQIWVRVTDANGCIGTDTIQVLNCINQYNLIIPNAFTPNGDGYNDYWVIIGQENYPNISVEIFDQWGLKVFRSERGYSEPWDGTSNGKKQPVSAYYYIINPGDGSKEITGSITLVR